MNKQDAVAALGQPALVQPARVREALKANDRLKLVLTLLQAAAAQAAAPDAAAPDLTAEIQAAGWRDAADLEWLRERPAAASRDADGMLLPGWARLRAQLASDLRAMALPVTADVDADPSLAERVHHWLAALDESDDEHLPDARLVALTHGRREHGDSLHLLVMDLHKAVNRQAARLHGGDIAGAHTWQLAADGSDRAAVEAFMRGLARTRALKLDHPGLDTSATRDADRLLIQNDIGTNDAHVLVLQVEGLTLTLAYSDLHRQRFMFFEQLLAATGASWSGIESRTSAGLNQGEAYHVGTATWRCTDAAALLAALEAVGARVVFLIDWNRARKRLQLFVGKDDAVAVLAEAARREAGHMAWLAAGGERLLWNAMAAQQPPFRLGERLDDMLGADAPRAWLVDVLVQAQAAVAARQPAAYVADAARLSLAGVLRRRPPAGDRLQEHAAWCHALAQGLADALAHGADRDAAAAERLALRAKTWERRADELVEQARAAAERQPAWAAQRALLEQADDVADALEEACFVLSLVAASHPDAWSHDVRQAMRALAANVLGAVQHHVKAVSALGSGDPGDHAEALDGLWRVVQAERRCDDGLRAARRALVQDVHDAAPLMLGNELAAALELASDHLLALGHALRRLALQEQ